MMIFAPSLLFGAPMVKKGLSFFVFLFFSLLPLGTSRIAVAADEVLVSAAASLTEAFTEMGKAYEAKNPGVAVKFNFAASGQLLQQIAQGAPVDIFASADQKTMDTAEEKGLIVSGTRRDFAGNRLVLITPPGSKYVGSLADIRGLSRIAIGNPEFVPAGRYVKAMLEKEGIWKDVEKSLILGVSVRQVLDYVARGEVDAGFVFATDATLAGDRVVGALEFSPPTPITYPISVVKGSAKAGLAESFISFVLSGDGKAILARYGFVVEGLIPLKKPDSRGVASIFQSLRRTPSTPHS